jgi:hypothetical protein
VPEKNTAKSPQGGVVPRATRVDDWLRANVDTIALLAVAIGLVVRLVIARRNFLVPDEALDYVLVNQASPRAAYSASLGNAHPPLFYLLLYYGRLLGTSEFVLRLPSAVAGAVMPWIAFEWMKRVLGGVTGLMGLLFLALSPAIVVVTSEVRPYGFLLLFMAVALYSLERAIQEDSVYWIVLSAIFQCLAILSHYSAVWFTITLGIYALARMRSRRLGNGTVAAWLGSQAGTAAILAWLYVSHISRLRGSPMEREAMRTWLSDSYFNLGQDRIAPFALTRTAEVFQYLLANDVAGVLVFLLFIVGLVLLFWNPVPLEGQGPTPRVLGLLLLLPFAIGCAAAFLRLYPYSGTRHSLYLAIFAMSGAGYSITRLSSRKVWAGLLGSAALLTASAVAADPPEDISAQNQAKVLMDRAKEYLHNSLPEGARIITEYQSYLMLRYYLCPELVTPSSDVGVPIAEVSCGTYRLISGISLPWVMTEQDFGPTIEIVAKKYGLKPGDTVWIVHAGWNKLVGPGTAVQLYTAATQSAEGSRLRHRSFGDNIFVFEATIPAAP